VKNVVLDIYNDELIRMLQNAHAGEIGAFHAYAGHIRATTDVAERNKLIEIQAEELRHINDCKRLLNHYGYPTNQLKDSIMKLVGQSLGLACFISGRRLAAWGAGLIEKIGMTNYQKMVDISQRLGNKKLVDIFTNMRDTETVHEMYFKGLLSEEKQSAHQV
jgi:demethoxyubiquinone hydroxylase (CLK1/Coq7/Cat5 family)